MPKASSSWPPMRKGSVYQRHTRQCPRDDGGKVLPHRCRGSWYFSMLIAPRRNGARRTLTRGGYGSKREAEAALREALAREETGVVDIHGLTVGQYLEQWLASKHAIRPTSRRGYQSDIRKYLQPSIGSILLAELRPHHIDLMYDGLLGSTTAPATPSTLRHVHTTLRAALNVAVRRRLISWNPAQHVELPAYDRPETAVWTPQELTAFLRATADHRLSTLFRLIAVTGLRRGEAIALHWRDLDLRAGALTVRWQLVDAGGGARLGPPKTRRGARVVPLDALTVADLQSLAGRQAEERRLWGEAWQDTGLVFTREDGSALRPDYVSHLFHKLVTAAGARRIRLHDLRHTNASLALAAGVPLRVVSDRLGHSSTAITSDLYTHVIPAVAQDAADKIAALLADHPVPEATPDYCTTTAHQLLEASGDMP